MRDQSYISGVSRMAEDVGKKLAGAGLVPSARGAGEEDSVGRLDEWSEKEEKLLREARGEGVKLVLLPKGMSRRNRNASRWDQK